jgi:hypothetical protein
MDLKAEIAAAQADFLSLEKRLDAIAVYQDAEGNHENASGAAHVLHMVQIAHATGLRELRQADREKRIPGDIVPMIGGGK